MNRIPILDSMYEKARVTCNRPLVCACGGYEWIHRRGWGECQVILPPGALWSAQLNSLNRLTRELALGGQL